MKVAFSQYSLFPPQDVQKKPRLGALLRVSFNDGSFGYADCHPWEELGDLPLDQQLKLLSEGQETSLTKQSVRFAQVDANARATKSHLFQGVKFPKNHYHIPDSSLIDDQLLRRLSYSGITLLKIKMGTDLQKDCQFLQMFSASLRAHQLKCRLDFNCKLSEDQFLNLLNQCREVFDVIDFFEDPFVYQPQRWEEICESYPIKLACDKDSLKALAYPDSCDYLVVKPAIQDVGPFLIKDPRALVLTSYLDHPIGQLSALYTAAKLLGNPTINLSTCGFLSHHAYVPTSFTQCFKEDNARLVPSLAGYGWGYDEILNALEWKFLS